VCVCLRVAGALRLEARQCGVGRWPGGMGLGCKGKEWHATFAARSEEWWAGRTQKGDRRRRGGLQAAGASTANTARVASVGWRVQGAASRITQGWETETGGASGKTARLGGMGQRGGAQGGKTRGRQKGRRQRGRASCAGTQARREWSKTWVKRAGRGGPGRKAILGCTHRAGAGRLAGGRRKTGAGSRAFGKSETVQWQAVLCASIKPGH